MFPTLPPDLFTANQFLVHVVGDYLLQAHGIALAKTRANSAALLHAWLYTLPFLLCFWPSLPALVCIMATHYVIDRYRLAAWVGWAKNHLVPFPAAWPAWQTSIGTGGYPAGTDPHIWFWLLVIVDNLMHVVCNALALKYL